MDMSRPVLYVDFNEMVDDVTVLLSQDDIKMDASGMPVRLHEGMRVGIYMNDLDENGNVDNLVANGIVVRNDSGIAGWAHVKWCCRIDANGIRPESEVTDA